MALSSAYNLFDFEHLAKKVLPRAMFSYIQNGAEDEVSMQRNRQGFEEISFVPRMLIDVSKRHQKIELFGEQYDSPFGISPVGLGAMYAYDGDLELARAATAHNVPYVLSGASLTRMEEVISVAPKAWFQAYLPGADDEIRKLLQRAEHAGYKNLVLTVDIPVSVSPDRYIRNGFSSPLRPTVDLATQGLLHPRWLFGTFLRTIVERGMPHLENWRADRGNPVLSSSVQKDLLNRDSLTWRHVEVARQAWSGALIVKGIVSTSDAITCRQLGVDGIIVSNHGGRQLDGAVSPIEVLESMSAATPELTIMMDSGVRRGTDVLKAAALGAKCVFAGRPFNYALAADGGNGVAYAISILKDEISRDMALLGIEHPYECTRDFIRINAHGVANKAHAEYE